MHMEAYSHINSDVMKALVGCQQNITVNIKYKPDRTLKNGIPCIILCNRDMDWYNDMSQIIKEWWEVNVIQYYLPEGEKFY